MAYYPQNQTPVLWFELQTANYTFWSKGVKKKWKWKCKRPARDRDTYMYVASHNISTLCLFLKMLRLLPHLRENQISFQMTHTVWNWTATSEDLRKRWCLFLIIFFIFYTLLCSISLNKPGRHKVALAVMRHMQDTSAWVTSCCKVTPLISLSNVCEGSSNS